MDSVEVLEYELMSLVGEDKFKKLTKCHTNFLWEYMLRMEHEILKVKNERLKEDIRHCREAKRNIHIDTGKA